ncbi:MAG TPA: hypothetical protein VKA59_25020 [Vicinamibacterales bacterium]|nr:hypothetical protein [Vicinamibacterales bacterium]
MKLVLVSIVVLLASPVYAQEKELNETTMGRLRHDGNAMLNDSKVDDPSEYRGGAPATQRSLVKISGDVVEGSHREEVVLIQLKQTGDRQRGGEFYLGLKIPGTSTTDEAMFDALVATYRDGFHFNLPIYAPNLPDAAVTPSFIQSPNGQFRTYIQNDGDLVTYEVMQPGNWLRPVWSSMSGPIPQRSGLDDADHGDE